MKILKLFPAILLFIALILALASCTPVAAYQKMYVNDKDMDVGAKAISSYENNMTIFREGAAGANGGKSGGGCACN